MAEAKQLPPILDANSAPMAVDQSVQVAPFVPVERPLTGRTGIVVAIEEQGPDRGQVDVQFPATATQEAAFETLLHFELVVVPATQLRITQLAGLVDGAHWVLLVALTLPGIEHVGAASIFYAETDMPTLGDVFVRPHARRTGVATQLVRTATRWAEQAGKDLYLHVRPDNPARWLYEAEGFTYTGEVKEDGSQWMYRPVPTTEGGHDA